jgi:hypothetical protein
MSALTTSVMRASYLGSLIVAHEHMAGPTSWGSRGRTPQHRAEIAAMQYNETLLSCVEQSYNMSPAEMQIVPCTYKE